MPKDTASTEQVTPEPPVPPEDAPLALRLFGPFEARVGGAPLPRLRSRRGQWLLALLALRPGRSVERGWLAGTLWPDSTQENAQVSLRQTLADLRHALGAEADCILSPTSRTLALDAARASVDTAVFDDAVRRGDPASLARAVALHERPLLEDCHEEWVLTERGPREESCQAALEVLAADALSRGEAAPAVAWLRRAVGADPYRESARRGLMTALARAGQWGDVTQTYRELRLLLHQELQIEPSEETRALYQTLRAESRKRANPDENRPTAPAEAPAAPPRPAAPMRHIPRPLTPLIGREREREDIGARLFRSRLVTLCGPGGVGKTRLAIEAAEEWAEDRPDGLWFVDLAPLSDPALVGQAVAGVLSVREEPGVPVLDRLTAFLRERRLLLVLDNCEHLLDACARLTDALLRECPGLRLLTTSRQALGLTGEDVCPVPPLPLPDCAEGVDADAVAASPAVRLFVERAAAIRPGFALTPQNADAVAQVCCRLDGIPLALELAAARVKVLSVEQIAARLDDRFRLLTQGSRASLPRQQTLRALLDWSYDLLSNDEKALLDRLSVFAGGWTLDAAESVCAQPGRDVLDPLSGLVDKSLVQAEPGEGTDRRYRMLETVREYGGQRLAERGEVERMRRRQREWCRALAESAGPGLHGPEQADWLGRLAREHDNLRAALEDFRAQGAARQSADGSDPGLRLANTLRQFWEMHGHYREGRGWLQSLLAQGLGTAAERARALNNLGLLAMGETDMAAARDLFNQGLALFRQAGDRRGVADALNNLGIVAWWQDDYAQAKALYEESLAVDRELNDTYSIAGALGNLGLVAQCQGHYDEALVYLEESLTLRQSVGDQRGIANTLVNMGVVHYDDGDDENAQSCCRESLTLFRALGQKDGIAVSLTYLGRVALRTGDPERARVLHGEALQFSEEIGDKRRISDSLGFLADVSLAQNDLPRARALFREQLVFRKALGDKRMLAFSFEGLARLATAQDQYARATLLCGAADALRTATGTPIPRSEEAENRKALEGLRDALGPTAFSAAWDEGRSLTLDAATAVALEHAAGPPTQDGPDA